jgi:hypothetical protein
MCGIEEECRARVAVERGFETDVAHDMSAWRLDICQSLHEPSASRREQQTSRKRKRRLMIAASKVRPTLCTGLGIRMTYPSRNRHGGRGHRRPRSMHHPSKPLSTHIQVQDREVGSCWSTSLQRKSHTENHRHFQLRTAFHDESMTQKAEASYGSCILFGVAYPMCHTLPFVPGRINLPCGKGFSSTRDFYTKN